MQKTINLYGIGVGEIKRLVTPDMRLLVGLSFLVIATHLNAQVSINTDGSLPDSSAMLDIKSTDRGILIPRMSTVQRTAINGGTPVTGLLVFDNTTASFWYYAGAAWEELIPDSVKTIADADNDTKIQVEESPDEDFIRFDLAGTERLVMRGACLEVMNSGGSVFIGEGAGINDDLTGNSNVFVGYQAGLANTSGFGNTANGYRALKNNTTGFGNTASGTFALYSSSTGKYNTTNGFGALSSNVSGDNNTAIGYSADVGSESLTNATAIGANAIVNTSNSMVLGNNAHVGIGTSSPDTTLHVVGNIKMVDGSQANGKVMVSDSNGIASWTDPRSIKTDTLDILGDTDGDTRIQVEKSADEDVIRFDMAGTEFFRMDSGRLEIVNTGQSVFIGGGAGANDDLNNNQNVFVGYQAGGTNTTGDHNTASGYQALYSNTTGVKNTASGMWALFSNTTGYGNTAHGYQALFSDNTGSYNTAIGYRALNFNTTGSSNTASGYQTLYSNTTGYGNTAHGHKALYYDSTGNYNTAIGNRALYLNTTGASNTASGYQALHYNTIGNYNTANGYRALFYNTTGINNTTSGHSALYSNTIGANNTAFGYSAFSSGAADTNSTALGFDAEPGASNTIRLGNSSVSTIGGYANWSNVSDGRFKTDIAENVAGLDFIMQLRPVTYHLDMDAIARFSRTPDSLRLAESEQLKAAELQSGFVAQEVEAAANAVGYDFHGVDKPINETSHYGLRYAEFVVPLVKAMQELVDQINGQQELIQTQQEQLVAQQKLNEEQLSVNKDLQEQINALKKLIEMQ